MTKVGEGQEADPVTSPAMAIGAPTVGEILAGRYELAEHINDDNVGRQVWRGIDVVLRRPVAVVLRYPGGDSAMEMLTAAVAASRVAHPNLVGVYDAVDEGHRAYVVREWVDGQSLRDLVAESVLDPARATSVAHAVAAAVAAVHSTGMVHGNIHPGTVMVGDDGRVVLADARADADDTHETDVRAIGGILYFALTGRWPHREAGPTALPDAMRDATGALAAPRQIRADIPAYLDDLTMDLLDLRITPPTSEALAAELSRLDAAAEEQFLDDLGPLRFVANEEAAEPPRHTNRKIAAGVVGLVAIALVGLLVGINIFAGGDETTSASPSPAPSLTAPAEGGQATPAPKPTKIPLTARQVRVVDPDGDRSELDGVEAVVDGDVSTGWKTHAYIGNPKFGGLKRGMGILIDLEEERTVTSVQVVLSARGASAEMRSGTSDPGSSRSGDDEVVRTFTTRIGEPFEYHNGTTMTFSGFSPDLTYRYLLLWLTELPDNGTGRYQIGVQEITVEGL